METKSKKRGRGRRGRGASKGYARGSTPKGRGGPRKKQKKVRTRLTRPNTFPQLLALFNDVPNMSDKKSNVQKLLQWYLELFFNTEHIEIFQDFSDNNPKNEIVQSELFQFTFKK